jgi:hypothetical protein
VIDHPRCTLHTNQSLHLIACERREGGKVRMMYGLIGHRHRSMRLVLMSIHPRREYRKRMAHPSTESHSGLLFTTRLYTKAAKQWIYRSRVRPDTSPTISLIRRAVSLCDVPSVTTSNAPSTIPLCRICISSIVPLPTSWPRSNSNDACIVFCHL